MSVSNHTAFAHPADQPKIGVFHPGTQRSHESSLALQQAGLLGWFATGIYYKPGRWPYTLVERLPGRFREACLHELRKRRNEALDDDLIRMHGRWEAMLVLSQRVGFLNRFTQSIMRRRDIEFGHWLTAHKDWMKAADAVYSFNSVALEGFRAAKEQGKVCVLDQTIAYGWYCDRLLRDEAERNPQFGNAELLAMAARSRARAEREDEEFPLADMFIAGSRYVVDTLKEAGVDESKVRIVGNVSTAPVHEYIERPRRDKLRLMFVGAITPRKGIYYLLEAVKRLSSPHVELVLVGRMDVAEAALAPYRHLFTHIPHVPRSELWDIYASADVFVLPTLIEGFARVLVEAAAIGLPIVTTTSSGGEQLIGDDECGFLLEPRDIDALVARLDQLCSDWQLRQQMGRRAWERSGEFTFERYSERVCAAVLESLAVR